MPDKPRISVGNQTAYSAATTMQPFEFAVENGFDAFEWFPDKKSTGEGWTVEDISQEMRAYIRRAAGDRAIRLSVHAPWPSDPLTAENAASFPAAVGFAEDIGASLFTIHMRTDLGLAAFTDALRPLLVLLGKAGIELAVENTVFTAPSDFNAFFENLRAVRLTGTSAVGMCIDIGHANLCSETRNDYLRFIDLLDDKVPIVHIHMHENYGDRDSHLTVFTGPAGSDPSGIEGLIERLNRRGFNGSIILEQWPRPQSLLIDARDRLIDIIRLKLKKPEYEGVKPECADGMLGMFVEANGRLPGWRKKLEWVLELLVESRTRSSLELLTYIAIYLRFLGTGELLCGEEGGHHRPSQHAKLSERIYTLLSSMEDRENIIVIRKIYPWLPSFDAEFMRAEPLTRIRDIAHRDDIPRELKQEIKTTLQNKLHRSAGPEDLVTSETLLKRITALGASYPESFVSEFARFHEELKDFFNAGDLKDILLRLKEKGDFERPQPVDAFLALIERSGEEAGDLGHGMKALECLTILRRAIGETGKLTQSKKYRLQIADIRLEDYLFVLLSTLINQIVSSHGLPWDTALQALRLTVENLRLGGLAPGECRAIESELGSWAVDFDPEYQECLLRLMATVDRCRRVAGGYSEKILALFPVKARNLGNALGVAENAAEVFAESDIRGHPVFQLSKLVSLLSRSIRTLAFLQPWDVIVPGEAFGRVEVVRSLAFIEEYDDGPVILLADKAEGDEEIPARVAGIVLADETPLLSHLAVRARQRGTVFASCEDMDRISKLRKLVGLPARIRVTAETFEITGIKTLQRDAVTRKRPAAFIPEVSAAFPSEKLLPLDRATTATCGAKADAARRLKEISAAGASDFEAPSGVVIPFGVMEESLHSLPSLEAEYHSAMSKFDGLRQHDQGTEKLLQRMNEIIMQLPLDDRIISGIAGSFGAGCLLMVRSSSNCEDGKDISGAGLYDSVPSVPKTEAAVAVRKVWASLWNKRAVLARQNTSVPHDRARMAVLIQEMKAPDISFILHTVNPINDNEDEILAELAVGFGETLASGREAGTPFRMVYRKGTGDIEMLAFASYSTSLVRDGGGGISRALIDYSKIPFSADDRFRAALGARIGHIACGVERAFGLSLDIEGLVVGGTICLVQARPQQGGKKHAGINPVP